MEIYKVRTSQKMEGKPYASNRLLNIVALNLDDAVAHIHKLMPAATIWAVTHQGTVAPDMITENALGVIDEQL